MSKALATKNVAAVVLAVALVAGFAFAFATPAKADAISDLQAQVQALLAQIAALQGGSSSTTSSGAGCFTFTANLKSGSTGSEVANVQKFLNGHGFTVAASGAGSAGNETTHFGPATKAAVIKFQNAYAADILTPVGLTAGNGNWFASTRAKANALCAGAPTPGGTPTPVPVTGSVSVSAGVQPANSLAPQGSSRVPFTTFTLTNGTNQAVTINSVTVQRAGLAQDAAFSGVVLIDSNGLQVGVAHTFNSNHQANVGDNFTLNPGQSVTYTVAGNMASSLTSYTGQVAQLQVVGVNTSVPVSGSLPITGASQTLNSTLAIGSVSTSTSSVVAPTGSTITKNIGDTGIKFSGVKFVAGSTEDLKLYSVRWRQVGTASSADLANIVTVVNGTSYPTTLDATGKYYTTTFPGGILIAKGNNLDVYVQGDIAGSNASSRTVDFDIDKVTDVYFVGQLYGYGIAPSGTFQPWYNGDSFSISGASVTTIGKDTGAGNAAQNIALNVSNQPLGGYVVDLKGEPISVQSTVISVASTTSGTAVTTPLTNVTIVDENGNVVAGPVDEVAAGTLTFTDTITYPLGRHVYSIRGKVGSSVANGSTFTLSTNPSTQWTSITGQTTGNTVALANGNFTLNTMTVKAGALAVSVGTTPVAQNIIAGGQGVTFTNIQLDASQSGEDVRLSSIPVTIDNGNNSVEGSASNLSTCQLCDGSTALNGGSNVVNPSTTATTSAVTATFTFDNSLVIPKGTVKTLAVKCNVSSSADSNSTFQVGMTSAQATGLSVTGATSGSTITATDGGAANGQVMTIASAGTLTATASSAAVAQPALTLVPAGTAGTVQGYVKFHATNEDIQVQKIGLKLTSGTTGSANQGAAGNSGHVANDNVVTAYLFNGSTQVGTVTFTGTTATSTLATPITVPANSDVTLTIKADIAAIGVNSPAGIGDTVKVDPLNAQGLGLASSQQVNISATAGVNGTQIFKTVPTVANGSGACTGTGCNGSNQVLKVITVKADAAGSISVKQLKFDIATSSATITAMNVSVYDNNGNVASSTFGAQINGGSMASAPTLTYTGGPVIIPAGATYSFKLTGTVTPGSSATNWSVSSTLQGDSAAIAGIGSSPITVGTTTSVADADAQSGFIWSDNATTTASNTDVDWFNGYQVSGLPSIGI